MENKKEIIIREDEVLLNFVYKINSKIESLKQELYAIKCILEIRLNKSKEENEK